MDCCKITSRVEKIGISFNRPQSRTCKFHLGFFGVLKVYQCKFARSLRCQLFGIVCNPISFPGCSFNLERAVKERMPEVDARLVILIFISF